MYASYFENVVPNDTCSRFLRYYWVSDSTHYNHHSHHDRTCSTVVHEAARHRLEVDQILKLQSANLDDQTIMIKLLCSKLIPESKPSNSRTTRLNTMPNRKIAGSVSHAHTDSFEGDWNIGNSSQPKNLPGIRWQLVKVTERSSDQLNRKSNLTERNGLEYTSGSSNTLLICWCSHQHWPLTWYLVEQLMTSSSNHHIFITIHRSSGIRTSICCSSSSGLGSLPPSQSSWPFHDGGFRAVQQ